MYTISIMCPKTPINGESWAHIIKSDLERIIQKCGLSGRLVAENGKPIYPAGRIDVMYFNVHSKRMTITNNKKIGYASANKYLHNLLHRLMCRDWEGKRIFPGEDAIASVNCNRQRHKIKVDAKGRLTLLNHPKEFIEDDLAMAALAGQSKLPRCLRIYEIWRDNIRGHHSCMGSGHEEIPAALKPSFKIAWMKRDLRRLKTFPFINDPLLKTRAERLRSCINGALSLFGKSFRYEELPLLERLRRVERRILNHHVDDQKTV